MKQQTCKTQAGKKQQTSSTRSNSGYTNWPSSHRHGVYNQKGQEKEEPDEDNRMKILEALVAV